MPLSDEARLVEALLFASADPLSREAIAARLPPDTDLGAILEDLRAHYAGRGVNLVEVAGRWHLRTAPDLADRLTIERTVPRKLPRATVETLAIIAYHQPVTRAEIEAIRGVALGKGTLDALLARGWVQPKGRRETPGRPVTWVTTDAFLAQFGLGSLSDLPSLDELKAAGLVGPAPATALGEAFEPES